MSSWVCPRSQLPWRVQRSPCLTGASSHSIAVKGPAIFVRSLWVSHRSPVGVHRFFPRLTGLPSRSLAVEECSDLLHVFLGLPSFSVAVEGPEISVSHRLTFSLYCRQGSSDLRQASLGLPSLSVLPYESTDSLDHRPALLPSGIRYMAALGTTVAVCKRV